MTIEELEIEAGYLDEEIRHQGLKSGKDIVRIARRFAASQVELALETIDLNVSGAVGERVVTIEIDRRILKDLLEGL